MRVMRHSHFSYYFRRSSIPSRSGRGDQERDPLPLRSKERGARVSFVAFSKRVNFWCNICCNNKSWDYRCEESVVKPFHSLFCVKIQLQNVQVYSSRLHPFADYEHRFSCLQVWQTRWFLRVQLRLLPRHMVSHVCEQVSSEDHRGGADEAAWKDPWQKGERLLSD